MIALSADPFYLKQNEPKGPQKGYTISYEFFVAPTAPQLPSLHALLIIARNVISNFFYCQLSAQFRILWALSNNYTRYWFLIAI